MSAEAFAIALHHSRAKGATLLVLLGIANHDGDGGSWPSIRTLAKYARTTPRQARRSVAELEQLGEIRRFVQRGGTAIVDDWRRPNLYHFELTCPADCDRTKNHRTRRDSAVELPLLDDDRKRHSQSYPHPRTRVSPPDVGVPPPPDTGVLQTEQEITNYSSSRSNPGTRARRVGACGHDMIPDSDRHCMMGCKPREVSHDNALA